MTWQKSEAKRLLDKDLMGGKFPLDMQEMKPAVVYLQRPEFADFEYKHFCNHL
jgi:hypothetical protein